MTTTENHTQLPGCSIALKCANDPMIERCLDSIDDDVSVNVVITPNSAIEEILTDRGVPYSVTDYGNIAMSTEISVQEAEHNNVIIMDSDTWFKPGSIRLLREALQDDIMAKPNLNFLSNSAMSNLIARGRHRFNNQPDTVSNPGLALRREEVTEACGGYIFNPLIRWTEDADLNYRAQRAEVKVASVADAVVYHDPVSISHELHFAFLYGVGKRLSIEHTPGREPYEEFPDIAMSALRGILPHNLRYKLETNGLDLTAFDVVWQAVYIAGYHAQKRTGKWALPD